MNKATPCNNICVIDRLTKLCIGCGRTGDEITDWISMNAAQKADIMALLPARLATMTSRQTRQGGEVDARSKTG